MDYTASGVRHVLRADVIDRASGAVLGALPGLKAFTVEKNLYNTIRGGGGLTVDLLEPVAWGRVLIRLWLALELDGQREEHPLLTAVPSLSGRSESHTGVQVTPVLKDTTSLLDDALGRTWAYAEGTVVTDAVRAVFAQLEIGNAQITPSAATLRAQLVFTPKQTHREVVNTLADAIGYAAAWADSMGSIRVAPYISPADRAEVFQLGYGGRSVTRAEVRVEEKLEAANHFVLITNGKDPLVAEGWNTDPNSGYSTVNQRVIPYTEEVEADSQATLDAKLAVVMAEAVTPDTKYTVSFRWFPIDPERPLELQDAGRFYAPARVTRGVEVRQLVDAKVTIVGMSYSWEKGSPLSHVQATLRGAD